MYTFAHFAELFFWIVARECQRSSVFSQPTPNIRFSSIPWGCTHIWSYDGRRLDRTEWQANLWFLQHLLATKEANLLWYCEIFWEKHSLYFKMKKRDKIFLLKITRRFCEIISASLIYCRGNWNIGTFKQRFLAISIFRGFQHIS